MVSNLKCTSSFLACDGWIFVVSLTEEQSNNVKFTRYNQIRGVVNEDESITYWSHVTIGEVFDMWSWQKFCQIKCKYPHLFV